MTDQHAEQIVSVLEQILAELKSINDVVGNAAKEPPAAAAHWAPRE